MGFSLFCRIKKAQKPTVLTRKTQKFKKTGFFHPRTCKNQLWVVGFETKSYLKMP